MIDHITVRVRNIEATLKFYSSALKPLGYTIGYDKTFEDARVVGLKRANTIDTWFITDSPPSGPLHIAWSADTRTAVDAFYSAAIAAGGKDNGKPGPRPHYGSSYYGAFVIDPDGNNIEAVCHEV